MNETKKNVRFLICQIAVALLGLLFMIVKERYTMLWLYFLAMAISVSSIYFNYSLCKFEMNWHYRHNEKKGKDIEPSILKLRLGKASEWTVFVIALVIVFLPI